MEQIFHQELSFEQFIERTRRPGRECHDWSGTVGRADWFGTETYDDALALLEKGWPEGTARLGKEKIKLAPVGDSFGFTSHFDVRGAEVDVGRFLSGEHECMLDYQIERKASAGRVVTLCMNATTSASFSPEDFARRGLCALRLIDTLESSGYRCDLRILQSSIRSGHLWLVNIQIKEPDQPLDMDRIAFILMHVSIYRRFAFRLLEQCPEPFFRELASTGGIPCDFPPDKLPENAIVVPKLLLSNPGELEKWEKTTLAQYLEPEVHAA